MSNSTTTVKHNKHRIHICPNDKKLELLNILTTKYNNMKIMVVSANDTEVLRDFASDNVTVMSDKELFNAKESTCELIISYDLPSNATLYMSRLTHATEMALILLDTSEQKHLYPIETLIGRAIKQEPVEGFEYEETKKMKMPKKPTESSKTEHEKSNKKSFHKSKSDRPKRESDSIEKSKSWEKKDKKPNQYLGKDENGKAIFSGKSGDRNHRYDGTPKDKYSSAKKVGRKINIKALKPKE